MTAREFFTLYGHLSRKSLDGLAIGASVRAGDRVATLGPAAVNGGWTPHFHLQILTDALGLGSDFPGVATPSRRAAWLALCPDPNLIARVPADRFPPHQPERERDVRGAARADRTQSQHRVSRPREGRARMDAAPLRRRPAAAISTHTTTCRMSGTVIRASSMPQCGRCDCSTRTRATSTIC